MLAGPEPQANEIAAGFDAGIDAINIPDGPRASARMSPMAMAVIGGLMTSGLLTLVVIPVIFTYMDGFQIWIFNRMQGKGKKGRSTSQQN